MLTGPTSTNDFDILLTVTMKESLGYCHTAASVLTAKTNDTQDGYRRESRIRVAKNGGSGKVLLRIRVAENCGSGEVLLITQRRQQAPEQETPRCHPTKRQCPLRDGDRVFLQVYGVELGCLLANQSTGATGVRSKSAHGVLVRC